MLATTVRWFASLVVLCLLAGTGANVRPRVDLKRADAGDLRMASTDDALPLVTARRASAPAPEQRFVAFAIVPAAPSFVTPPRALVSIALAPATQLAPTPGHATSARGPPDDRFSVEKTVRS